MYFATQLALFSRSVIYLDGVDWCREPLPANEYGCDRNILPFAQTAESGTD